MDSVASPCSHQRGGAALEVAPCTRCGTFRCEDCGTMAGLCLPCARAELRLHDARTERVLRGFMWSFGGGTAPLVVSAFFFQLPALLILGVALVAGLWGGVSAGNRLVTSTLCCLPGLATSFGTLFSVEFYLARAGGTVQLRELVLPVGAAALIFGAMWFATTKFLDWAESPR